MLKTHPARCIVSASLLSLVCLATSAQETRKLDLEQLVPAHVIQAATVFGTPEGFVRALASAGVPAGVVLKWPPTNGGRASRSSATAAVSTPLQSALQQFKESHPDYEVSTVDGTALLFPMSSACIARLGRKINLRYSGPAFGFLDHIAKTLDPSTPNIPPGLASGGSENDDISASEGKLFVHPVIVDVSGVSLRDAMAAFVRQVPGLVWGVREEIVPLTGMTRCELTLLTAHRTANTPYELK